ncbi:MAG: hypothetical protein ACPLTR_06475 [Thermacetogeniaceae bacterium]
MKRRFARSLVMVFLSVLLVGCAGVQGKKDVDITKTATSEKSETEQDNVAKPGDYFPLTKGSIWEYEGSGNEYASFTREVLFTEGNRSQVKEDNGGTVSAAVFETTENAVVRVINRAEAYEPVNMLNSEDEERTVILKAPLKVGTEWRQGDTLCEIVATDATVETPAGVFHNCIKVKKKGSSDDVVFEYYSKGVGMVKREFISGDVKVTSSLKKYRVSNFSS